MSKGGFRVHEVWYVVWTDDFDGVGTSVPLMEEIINACNIEWAVKQTSNEYMVGVQRKFHTNPDGTQHATMLINASMRQQNSGIMSRSSHQSGLDQ